MEDNKLLQIGIMGILLTMVLMGTPGWGWVLFVLLLTF
jgi:hypothetical protein